MNELRRRGTLAAILPALSLLCHLPPAAAAAEEPVVREIVVRGYRGDPAAIKDILQTKEGQPLDNAKLNDDLARLLRAGHLATSQVEPVPTGVRIVFEISEALRVRNVDIKGAGRDWGEKMRQETEPDHIVTRPSDALPPAILRLPEDQRFRGDKERIRAFCQKQGYRAVTVISETTPIPGTIQIDVTFQVDLGPKYQVKWLRFVGNHAIPDGQLKEHMTTKRDTLFTSRRYCDAVFEEDILALQDYYRFRGFPNARVTERRVFKGPQGNKVDVTIYIDEGQQYPVASIDTKGNKAITKDTVIARVPLKVDGTYSDQKLIECRQDVERLYHETGYPYVSVSPTRQLNAAGDGYDVAFEIEEGERVAINTVRTRGHPRTRREVILREMELEPGMVYDVRKLERSQRALDRLQYFDNVVMKLIPADPPAPGERDLLVDVTESQTGTFRFGVGFSSTDAIVGTIELAQRNFDWRDWPKSWSDFWSGNAFVGAGQTFRISLMPGTVYSNYAIAYENPYWKGRNESFGWSLYHRTRDQDTWDETRTGLRITRGVRKYHGDPDTDLILHARLESVSVSSVEDDAPDDAKDEKGSHPVLGTGVTWRRDRTDRPVFPTKGYQWDLGAELIVPHGIGLGYGRTHFFTLGKHPKDYERVLSLRGRIDYLLGDFPIYERLYAGGANLRGFAYRGAGPHDNDEPIGGKYRALFSAEYRFPIAARTLYGVLFTDTGTVTRDFSLFTAPRLSVGFGVRLHIPKLSQAPISVDFSIPVIKQGSDDTEFLYFSLSINR
jgi:outer membrane protein insertion porin family